MAIKELVRGGKVTYQVNVAKRSNANPAIRIQLRKSEISTRSEALRIERRLKEQAFTELVKRERQGHTWGSLVKLWKRDLMQGKATGRNIQDTTVEDYIQIIDTYTPVWKYKQAQEITKAEVRAIIQNAIGIGKSHSGAKKIKNVINCVFNWGIDSGKLRGMHISPAHGIKIDSKNEKRPEILSAAEIQMLLTKARLHQTEWFPVWAMAIHTGMRSGELFALLWSDIDFDNRIIRVTKSFNKRTNSIKSMKGGYWRDVPMNDEVVSLLRDLKLKSNGNPHVLPRITDWNRGEQARVLRTFCSGIGLPSIKFHTLRACFANPAT